MKNKKIDKNYIFIILFCLFIIFAVIPKHVIFGSKVDWISQHIVFPDYFRSLFYKTGNIFPNFALAIGAGQNIYNFSYYGLLSPIVLISYLFPFVSMSNYIIISNVILYVLFGILVYYFLKTKVVSSSAFVTTLILLCSGSILFHFHRHFMFVNYLPFLVLGMIGVDKYFDKNKKDLLIISIFMIIMISYYYSVICILVICIYGLYKYLAVNQKFGFKEIIKDGIKFLIPIFIAILMSSILLLPTIYVIKNDGVRHSINLSLSMFLPKYNIRAFIYGNYSMGLTALSVLSIIYLFYSTKKEDKVILYIILLLISIPIFNFLLNGMLYERNKVFIPFIPIVGLFISKFIDDIYNKKTPFFIIASISIIMMVVTIICDSNSIMFCVDLLILILSILIYYKDLTNKFLLTIIFLISPITILMISNQQDEYVNGEFINISDKNKKEHKEIKKILKKEKQFIRFNNLDGILGDVNEVYSNYYNQNSVYSSISNKLYKKFYIKTFNNALRYRNSMVLAPNNDILFETFMGVKYIYSPKYVPSGYKKVSKNIYKNDNILPIFYGSDKLTNVKTFNNLDYPYNIGTLLNSVVVNSKPTQDITNTIHEIKLDYKVKSIKNLKIDKSGSYIKIKSKDNGKMKLKINKNLKEEIIIIKLKLKDAPSCTTGDARITINGVSNVLTCNEWIYKNNNKVFTYVLSNNKSLDELNIKFKKNIYKISYIKIYSLKYSDLDGIKKNLSTFNIIKNDIDGKGIIGNINMKKKGYFVSSIPYDKGFVVYVDNKKIKTEVVNKAFLGFKLNKGKHKIKIVYTSPFFKEGVLLSMIGFILCICYILYNKKKID